MKLKNLLPLIGLVLFIFILYKVGIFEIVKNLQNINLIYLPIIFFFSFILMLPATYKLKYILSKQGMNVGFLELLKLTFMGLYYGLITPGRIGYFTKIYYLKKSLNKKFSEVMPSVFIDRVLDFFVLICIGFIGSFLLLDKFLNTSFFILIVLFGFVLSFWIFYNKKRTSFILKHLYKIFIPLKFKSIVKENFNSLYDNLPKKRYLILPILLTLLDWVFYFSAIFFIAVSLGIKINYLLFIFIYSIVIIISLLPISLAGFGIREGGAVVILSSFGIGSNDAVLLSLLSFLLMDFIWAFLGFLFSFKMKEKNDSINNNTV